MAIVAAILGAAMLLWVLWEGFETAVLPRRVTRWFRLRQLYEPHVNALATYFRLSIPP